MVYQCAFSCLAARASSSRFVGAFVGAVAGAVLFGLAIHGFSVPGQNDTDVMTALEAIPGALLGIAAVYFYGASQGNEPL